MFSIQNIICCITVRIHLKQCVLFIPIRNVCANLIFTKVCFAVLSCNRPQVDRPILWYRVIFSKVGVCICGIFLQGLTLRQALLSGTSTFSARTIKNYGLYADLTHNLSQTVTNITVGQVANEKAWKKANILKYNFVDIKKCTMLEIKLLFSPMLVALCSPTVWSIVEEPTSTTIFDTGAYSKRCLYNLHCMVIFFFNA